MSDIYTFFPYILQMNHPSVFVKIVQTEGSVYRKEGSSMLILENGDQIGMLSGGCLENDLSEQAKNVLATNEPRLITYDLRSVDDLGWGKGAGCNGSFTLLVEPVTLETKQALLAMKHILDQNQPVISITYVSKQNHECQTSYYTANGLFQGKEPTGISSSQLRMYLNQTVASKRGCLFLPSLDDDGFYFFHYIAPKPRLFIFGAGKDARFLSSLATKIGFSVFVLDWREAYCNRYFFPDAAQCLVASPSELTAKVTFYPDDSIVIMTHQFEQDHLLLETLLSFPIHYLGILGPRTRTERLLGNHKYPANLHSPVGLPIGAEGPEEIAISIMAEIIQAKHKRMRTWC
ncbi:XdhC family protein [Brevibacillus laterosporus]|uniref:XdhC family protein n=1 Tax=Brevibacillus laterosporus TaxID=1465 RepID=UPI003D1CA2DF